MKNNVITIAKGVGIILMVIAHSRQTDIINKWIAMFHMPLFFILAGYCFKEKYLEDVVTFVWRRVKGLYFPFVKYGLLFLLLHNVFYYLNIYNGIYGWLDDVSHLYTIKEILHNAVYNTLLFTNSEQLLGGYWFLIQLFWASILGLFFIKFLRNPIVGVIFSLLISMLMEHWMFHLRYTCVGSLTFLSTAFFLIGYVIKKYNIESKGHFGWLCALIVLAGAVFWQATMLTYSNKNILPYFITAIIGTLMTVQFANWINMSIYINLKNFLIFTGENTIQILTWHFLCFKLVSLLIIYVEEKQIETLSMFPIIRNQLYPMWWLLYTIVGVGVPLIVVYFANRKSKIYEKTIS